MDRIDKKFFKKFDIQPSVKKGGTYWTAIMRFAQVIADEDIYPVINGDILLKLEEVLLDWNDHVEITITKDISGKYSYLVVSDNEANEEYHHGFNTKNYKTRKEALLSLLIKYSYVEYIKEKVKDVFMPV